MNEKILIRNFLVVLIVLLLSNIFCFAQKLNDNEIQGMHFISSHKLFDNVKELSSDKYGGRLSGTYEYDLSASWLVEQFKKNKINPLINDTDYLQWYNIPYTTIFPDCQLTLHKRGKVVDYKYVTDFIPGATSGSGDVTAEVIYAGYGITAPELNYDDYADIDVKGKIILIEREVPLKPENDPEMFLKWEPYSYHQYKLKNAVKQGAIGMIYNYGPITNPNNAYYNDFVYTHVGDNVVADVFEGYKFTHDELVKRIKKELKSQSFSTGKIITIKNITEHHPEGRSSNVLAWIEGNDPVLKNEYIVISAHLDHTGKCWEIMPGANDNASGIAVMLEIAKALKNFDIKLKRSVIFAAFGSEEQGIIGSKYFIENPIVSLDNIMYLINLDGVGSGDKIFATAGKTYPELFEPLKTANDMYIHRLIESNDFLNITRPRLDAARFMKAGIPSVSFSAFGNSVTNSVYHQPGDNIEIIDPEIMEDIAQLIYIGIIRLANH